MTTARRRGNQVGSWVAGRALGLTISDATSGYRAFSREALLRLNILSEFTYTLDTIIDASRQKLVGGRGADAGASRDRSASRA